MDGNSMSASKIVKRYANRKLYDTERSCYVTLEDISLMIKAGDEVRVIDNKTGEDLTSVTLAQIIFETEKKNNFMPLSLLRGLIQNGSEAVNEYAQKKVEGVQLKAQEVKETAQKLRTELEDRIGSVMRKPDAAGESAAPQSKPQVLAELLTCSQKAFDELQKGVEDRVKGPVGAITRYATLGNEMQEIRQRMTALEQRLENIPQ
jgi:polyhydroxyalkanoate synthesis repressor PhaR